MKPILSLYSELVFDDPWAAEPKHRSHVIEEVWLRVLKEDMVFEGRLMVRNGNAELGGIHMNYAGPQTGEDDDPDGGPMTEDARPSFERNWPGRWNLESTTLPPGGLHSQDSRLSHREWVAAFDAAISNYEGDLGDRLLGRFGLSRNSKLVLPIPGPRSSFDPIMVEVVAEYLKAKQSGRRGFLKDLCERLADDERYRDLGLDEARIPAMARRAKRLGIIANGRLADEGSAVGSREQGTG